MMTAAPSHNTLLGHGNVNEWKTVTVLQL